MRRARSRSRPPAGRACTARSGADRPPTGAPGASPSWSRSTTWRPSAPRTARCRRRPTPTTRSRVAILEARGIAGAFLRLGREARPPARLALRGGRRGHHRSPARLLRGDRMTKQPRSRSRRSPLDRSTPDPDNARIHGRDNLTAITASLERFGQVRPLLTSRPRRGRRRQRHARRDARPGLDRRPGPPPAVGRTATSAAPTRSPTTARPSSPPGTPPPGRSGRADCPPPGSRWRTFGFEWAEAGAGAGAGGRRPRSPEARPAAPTAARPAASAGASTTAGRWCRCERRPEDRAGQARGAHRRRRTTRGCTTAATSTRSRPASRPSARPGRSSSPRPAS